MSITAHLTQIDTYDELDSLAEGTVAIGSIGGRILQRNSNGRWYTIGIQSSIVPILPVWVILTPDSYHLWAV